MTRRVPFSNLWQCPLMQQYQEMKKKHPDAVLLFRVGDFYEIFGKDAVTASEILGITLTRRGLRFWIRFQLNFWRLVGRNRFDHLLLGSLFQLRVFQLLTDCHSPANGETIQEGSTTIQRTEGDFVPGQRSTIKAEPVMVDMSPRPFSEDIQFFHHNGSMVVQDGLVGFLSEVRKSGATFNPLELKPEQAKRAMLYVTLSETYQQLYKSLQTLNQIFLGHIHQSGHIVQIDGTELVERCG